MNSNSFEIANLLVNSGVKLDSQNFLKETSISIACTSGNSKIVKLLIETNASLNIQDQKGFTPLHCAVMKNKADIVQMLIETDRCHLNIKNRNGKTPLDLAFENNLLEIAQMISNKMSQLLQNKEHQLWTHFSSNKVSAISVRHGKSNCKVTSQSIFLAENMC